MSLAMESCRNKQFTYERRRPEFTPCFKIVNEHLSTFMAEREAEHRPLPEYVAKEFEAFLKCGILAYGFIRLKCLSCHAEEVVGFSCKKRGFCPSCAGKRMAEQATHLTENVLPLVPYRQFVLSFPIPMRYWLHTNRKFGSRVFKLVAKIIHQYYVSKAENAGIKNPAPGSISFTQRWGSALNLTPHLHILCIDGVYTRVNGVTRFKNIPSITDDDVSKLVEDISKKVQRLCIKEGYLSPKGDIIGNPTLDSLFSDHEILSLALGASISGKIAFGLNAGRYVRKIGNGFGYEGEIPLAKGKRCYSVNGFSLHANTAINTHARDKLYKLIEYMARGPISNERLEILENGEVKLALKTPWANGTTHLLFTPSEFIEKLVALIPPPKTHLVSWRGVFAPNSPYKNEIRLKPMAKKGFDFEGKDELHPK